ncbi:g1256 [Coccomyxa viridis]|uniref:G1256 protein n=1 Tax=Coccomyxa viridis TaxID=1274662 RepID=A0ABP1FN09_9CHLO
MPSLNILHTSSNDILLEQDTNRLTTALNIATAAEDYKLAAHIRDRLAELTGSDSEVTADWTKLGIPEWLAERAERIGYRFPTDVQKRASRVLNSKSDAIIQSATGSGKTLSFVMPLLGSALRYPPEANPAEFPGPQLMIVVPTKELGVQTVMLIYKLLGGSVNSGVPGDPTNMFGYTGPRGIKVKGVLDKEEVLRAKHNGHLFATHVVVGTPECLAELSVQPSAFPLSSCLRAIAVDEVDGYSQEQNESLDFILSEACSREGLDKPQLVLAGATLPKAAQLQGYVQKGYLRDAVTLRVGELGKVPAGLQHRYIVADQARKLLVMCRQLRLDLRQQGQDVAPARVIVFCADEDAAKRAAMPLRSGLWGEHTVSVLLPHGEEPIQALHAFRDNKASFLIATPQAARGLDMPAVSHVYNLDLPEDAVTYLHRAGRAGRIGSPVKGLVTTMVTPEQVDRLQEIAGELELSITEQSEPPLDIEIDLEGDMDTAKKGLDDLYNLL